MSQDNRLTLNTAQANTLDPFSQSPHISTQSPGNTNGSSPAHHQKRIVSDFSQEVDQRMSINQSPSNNANRRRGVILSTSKAKKKLRKSLENMRIMKKLAYINQYGVKDWFEIDSKEYERLKCSIGVDFDSEGQGCINLFVKTLLQELPSGWKRETDLNDSVVYYNSKTHELTNINPHSIELRKAFNTFFKIKREAIQMTKEQEKATMIPQSSLKHMEAIKRAKEQEQKKVTKQQRNTQQVKIVLGSSLAQKLLKAKIENHKAPADLIQALVFQDTRSEKRFRELTLFAQDMRNKYYQEVYVDNEDFGDILNQTFNYYQRKFTKILLNTNQLECLMNEEENAKQNQINPDLPEYIKKNSYFKALTLEELLDLSDYYDIESATEYYLLWIPRIALGLSIPKGWSQLYKVEEYNQKEQNKVFKHIETGLTVNFHPADPYIRYLIQIYKKHQRVKSQTHFKNFDLQLTDPLGRNYDAKNSFCQLLGIDNIVKHSIYVKLLSDMGQANKLEQKRWFREKELLRQKDSVLAQNQAIEDEYDKFSDAEIFAIAQQVGLDINSEIHLLNFLVMIVAQVKANFQTSLEFRYVKNNSKEGIEIPEFYWRDGVQDKNHQVFPLLSEVKQRFDVLKGNMQIFEKSEHFMNFNKELDRYKVLLKANPKSLQERVQTEKHLVIEQFLTTILEKGRLDPQKFILSNRVKHGKTFFKLSKDDVDHLFHLLGNKVKRQDILDFVFQSPFRFEFDTIPDEEQEKQFKLLKELESENFKYAIGGNSDLDDDSDLDEKNSERPLSIIMKRMNKRKDNYSKDDQLIKKFQNLKNKRDINAQSDIEEDDDEDSDEDSKIRNLLRKKDTLRNQLPDIDFQNNPSKLKQIPEIVTEVTDEPLLKDGQKSPKEQPQFINAQNKQGTLKKPSKKQKFQAPQPMIKLDKKFKADELGLGKEKTPMNILPVSVTPHSQLKTGHKAVKGNYLKNNKPGKGLYQLKSKESAKNKIACPITKEEILSIDRQQSVSNDEFEVMFSNKRARQKTKISELNSPSAQIIKEEENQNSKESIDSDSNQLLNSKLISPVKFDKLAHYSEEVLQVKLNNILEDIEHMAVGIKSLLIDPPSNPLVNKLSEIIHMTGINIEDFLDGLENFEKQQNKEVVIQLISNIVKSSQNQKSTGEQEQFKETEEEASEMAEQYFNMFARKKKNSPLKQQIQDSEKKEDDFLDQKRKIDIYDRLVKALFKMTKNKIANLNDLISENMLDIKESEDKSNLYKNFKYIGSHNGNEEDKLQPKHEIFHDFTSKLESLGKQLNFVTQKTHLGGSYGIHLKRERHLVDGEYISAKRLNTVREINSDFDVNQPQNGKVQLNIDQKKPLRSFQDLTDDRLDGYESGSEKEFRVTTRSHANTTFQSDEDMKNHSIENKEGNTRKSDSIQERLQIQEIGKQDQRPKFKIKDFVYLEEPGKDSIQTNENQTKSTSLSPLRKQSNEQRQNLYSLSKDVYLAPYLQKVKFKQNYNPNFQNKFTAPRDFANFRQHDKNHTQRFFHQSSLGLQSSSLNLNQLQQTQASTQQSLTLTQSIHEEDVDQRISQIFNQFDEKRSIYQYYCELLGEPQKDIKFLKTNEILNMSNISQKLRPEHVIEVAKQFKLQIEQDHIRQINKETDLMWIAQLYLIVDIQSTWTINNKIFELIAQRDYDRLCKFLITKHPAYDYFKVLLQNAFAQRKLYLQRFTNQYQQQKAIEDCSWLCFKEKRLYHKTPKDYNIYYFNFYTNQRTYMIPDALIETIEYSKTSFQEKQFESLYQSKQFSQIFNNDEIRNLDKLEYTLNEIIQRKISRQNQLAQVKPKFHNEIKIIKGSQTTRLSPRQCDSQQSQRDTQFMYKRLKLNKSKAGSMANLQISSQTSALLTPRNLIQQDSQISLRESAKSTRLFIDLKPNNKLQTTQNQAFNTESTLLAVQNAATNLQENRQRYWMIRKIKRPSEIINSSYRMLTPSSALSSQRNVLSPRQIFK